MGKKLVAAAPRPGVMALRIIFCGAAVFYALLIIFWGRHDLGRVHREYRQVSERLGGGYAQELAEREVAAGCRQAVGGEAAPGYGDCLRASGSLVQKRAVVIGAELAAERRQVLKKLLLFYTLAGGVLIIMPLALLYGIMVFLLYLLRNIRFKNE